MRKRDSPLWLILNRTDNARDRYKTSWPLHRNRALGCTVMIQTTSLKYKGWKDFRCSLHVINRPNSMICFVKIYKFLVPFFLNLHANISSFFSIRAILFTLQEILQFVWRALNIQLINISKSNELHWIIKWQSTTRNYGSCDLRRLLILT